MATTPLSSEPDLTPAPHRSQAEPDDRLLEAPTPLTELPVLYRRPFRALLTAAIVVGLAAVGLTWKVLQPVLARPASDAQPEQKVFIPPYDYRPYVSLPVQSGGRTMPFCTAAEEAVRNVTGRARFQGQDPVAVVLQWMLLRGQGSGSFVNWEKYPFILCDHHDLRRILFEGYTAGDKTIAGLLEPDEAATEEQLHGKYVSPEQLRRSEAFKNLVERAEEIRQEDPEKATQLMSPEQRKAQEVAGRLVEFDSISQNDPPTWGTATRRQHHPSPFHLVALDRVSGGGWFGLDQLRDALLDDRQWQAVMKERLADSPQLYLKPEIRRDLEEFQSQVKAGRGNEAIDRLAAVLKGRRDEEIARFRKAVEAKDEGTMMEMLHEIVRTADDRARLAERLGDNVKAANWNAITDELRAALERRDAQTVQQLRLRLPGPHAKYHPADLRFRMLHLDYLEALHPDLYPQSAAWQSFPRESAQRVLTAFDRLAKAYQDGDPAQFHTATDNFLSTLREVSQQAGAYPGDQTVGGRVAGLFTGATPGTPAAGLLNLEVTFDRLQPFRWGWVLMLTAVVLFAASLATGSRVCHVLGFAAALGSLGFQSFGFFARVVIAGRPPVSNMYETVIWVSFMSAVFGLVLEVIYRRQVIGLAAAMVSTLGLVLADQLPLVLDPKISPLTPVLRSNYWLTIHVLTIVSSYAAGTLAWGLGNLSLALLAFGRYRRETLQMLSRFTYRALQLAVLLLAAGTFLGGWWAAESWGRFWGWDPKEVWALIALVSYVIPLHMRYIGWVKDFGLAVAAVVCYAAIVMAWYGVNFVLGAGLHSYGFGGGGPWWVFWAGLLNLEWVLIASMLYLLKSEAPRAVPTEMAAV